MDTRKKSAQEFSVETAGEKKKRKGKKTKKQKPKGKIKETEEEKEKEKPKGPPVHILPHYNLCRSDSECVAPAVSRTSSPMRLDPSFRFSSVVAHTPDRRR